MSNDNPYTYQDDDSRRQFQQARYVEVQRTSTAAVVSLVSGLLAFPSMCLCFFSIPFSIVAIVCGHSARATVRRSGGAYGGDGLAIGGMTLGYVCLALTISALAWIAATEVSQTRPPRPRVVHNSPTPLNNEGEILLGQAEGRLLSGNENDLISGISTCEHNARSLADHFLETLHIVDKNQFAETNSDAMPEQRAYRVFVQLNSDSAAFLLYVPEFVRFTDAAKQTLAESCWLIAQRSVDELLPENSQLAVAIYSDGGCEQRMIGITKRSGTTTAGLQKRDARPQKLAKLFRLAENPTTHAVPADAEFDSQIDNKPTPGELTLPAEAE